MLGSRRWADRRGRTAKTSEAAGSGSPPAGGPSPGPTRALRANLGMIPLPASSPYFASRNTQVQVTWPTQSGIAASRGARSRVRRLGLTGLAAGHMSARAVGTRLIETANRSRAFQFPAKAARQRGNEEDMAKTKFRPLHDRVVVKRIDAEEKTAGGIIIPDTAKEKPMQGQVVAVGPAAATRRASSSRSTSRPATRCCSASGRAPRSSSMARNS